MKNQNIQDQIYNEIAVRNESIEILPQAISAQQFFKVFATNPRGLTLLMREILEIDKENKGLIEI